MPTAAGSKRLGTGNKARQREDVIDRSVPFSNALRLYGVPATDVDYVITNGANTLRLIIEHTCPDERVYSPKNYLAAIDKRRRDTTSGNHNDQLIMDLALKLGVRALLVVSESNVEQPNAKVWWRYVDEDLWHERKASEFFSNLRKFAVGEL